MGDDELTTRPVRALAAAIRSREISPVELLEACLARTDAVNDQVLAVIWRNDDQARAAAAGAADAVLSTDADDLPPFHAVPIPIKDLTPVAGWPVTYGSWGVPDAPSDESALVVDAFRRGGFLLSGRTNVPAFGPITASENVRYGISRNPWDTELTPGGSSGGAAAAVAAGIYPAAHGNDGGGSLRIPASCCGLVGLKVSRGRVPHRVSSWEGGAIEGVLTRDVADTAAILDLISGPDRGLWYNAPPPERPFIDEVGRDPGRLRIGLVEAAPLGLPVEDVCLTAVRQAGRTLEGLGHSIETISFDVPDEFVTAFLDVANTSLADHDEVDWELTEPHIRARLAAARAVDSLTYVRAVHQLQRFTRDVVGRWGRDFDVLLTPTMTVPPPPAGEILRTVHSAPDAGPALPVLQMAVFNSGFNMTGQPAISLPTHVTDSGLPIGVQLVGGPWEEATLLRLSSQMEQAVGWLERPLPRLT